MAWFPPCLLLVSRRRPRISPLVPLPKPVDHPLPRPPALESSLDFRRADRLPAVKLAGDHLEGPGVDRDEIVAAEQHEQVRSGVSTDTLDRQKALAQLRRRN